MVNCHGWQFEAPPIASSVRALRVMLADGTVVRCSRTEQSELFSLVLGGYGLFGVILDVELETFPNERYRCDQRVVPIEELVGTFARLLDEPQVAMAFARLNVVPDDLLEEAIVCSFQREAGPPPELAAHGLSSLRRAIFRGSAGSDYGKSMRWFAESELQSLITPESISRNALLSEEVTVFENRSADTTDVLHEYFVPFPEVDSFLERLRAALRESTADLMNVTVRFVGRDDDTVLSYADRDMLAFVMLFVQPCTDAGEAEMLRLTRRLIDVAHEHEGRYYLPYRLHATPEQFAAAYPEAQDFFDAKRRFDPGELFQSRFYERYGR